MIFFVFRFCNVIGKNDVFCFCPKTIGNMKSSSFGLCIVLFSRAFVAHRVRLNSGEGVVLMLREEKVGRKQWAAGSFVTERSSKAKLKGP